MILSIDDWVFDLDLDRTMEHSSIISHDHCECGYCRNFYESVDEAVAELRPFLAQFGAQPEGPVQLMPFEPTLCLAFYRIYGNIIQWGKECLFAGDMHVVVSPDEKDSFILEVGEIALPWVLDEDVDEVISPANEPEFMDRMLAKWLERQPMQGCLS